MNKLPLIILAFVVISSQANAATRYMFFVSRGTLQQITSKNNAAWSSPVTVPTSNLYSSSSVAAITLQDLSLRVYYQSVDGSIMEASSSPSSNTWVSKPLPINSTIHLGTPLSATYSGGIFVFFLDGSFTVRMAYTANIWVLAPTSVFGFQAHAESKIASVNLSTSGDLRIYYSKSPSSNIVSEIGTQAGKWQSSDVPNLAGTVFTSILYVSPPQTELHVYAANVYDEPATIKDATFLNGWNKFGTPTLFDKFALNQASRLISGPYDGYYSYLYVIDATSTMRELYLGRGYVGVGVLAQPNVRSLGTTTVY